MQYLLRFECYDNPSRQSSTPIHPDIILETLRHFDYGQLVRVGDDADAPAQWARYRVANFPLAEPIANALLIRVFLAPEERWAEFSTPRTVWQALEGLL